MSDAAHRRAAPRAASFLLSETTTGKEHANVHHHHVGRALYRRLEPDRSRRPPRRRRWSPDARYVDPQAEAQGREQIDATIDAVQAQFPSFAFRLAGPVDAHHDQVRFGWELGPQDGPAPITGPDVAVADPEGRLELVLGFLDRVPAASNTARLTTRAADMRRRLVNRWAGWPDANAAVPQVLITESGATLSNVALRWSLSDPAAIRRKHAKLIQRNFDRMGNDAEGAGIAMLCAYLFLHRPQLRLGPVRRARERRRQAARLRDVARAALQGLNLSDVARGVAAGSPGTMPV